MTTKQNISRRALIGAGLSLPLVAGLAPTAFAYTANPSGGRNGTFTDTNGLGYTDSRGLNSKYHLRASHLAGKAGPFPMVIHLHGDGAYEYYNPSTWTSPQYAQVARDNGALFVLPKTPNRNETWWSAYSSTQWLADFIRFEMRYYNIDKNRIYISGFSGGAQITAYNLVADFHTLFTGGGAMMLGGGGTSGMSFTGTPAAKLKTDFLMRWHVGALDDGRNTSDGFNALAASKQGYDFYTSKGWNTRRVLIPGEDHNQSEDNGPAALRSLITESRQLYGI